MITLSFGHFVIGLHEDYNISSPGHLRTSFHLIILSYANGTKKLSSILLVLQVSLVSLVAQVKDVVCHPKKAVRKAKLKSGWVSQIVYFKMGLISQILRKWLHIF